MPYPDNDSLESSNNRLIKEELDYNIANLRDEFHQLLTALTNEQKGDYDDIITVVENNRGGVFFVYGHWRNRQILPVIPNASRQDIVTASLSSSYIWEKCKVLRLTKNMRLTVDSESSEIEQTKGFFKLDFGLRLRQGGSVNDGEAVVDIPHDFLIIDSMDPVSALFNLFILQFL
ncbi:uncharacterized protein LOC112523762 [Cynara cardunculus var. scolymus]|uniref:uncharacterized protein LOC112523762 n=1 Tax=Cynara cardunculus var. scolymus TaxID=59895 RepID=UPI000D629626|nr:uncharacterized protein LOC112523762 [Cynara cardunculus var. scolymus]